MIPVKTPYICVVDLEATCWENGNQGRREEMETIEIGAVLAETAAPMFAVSEFQIFVRPVRNPVLSDFCRSLTSIEQRQVDGAHVFSDAMGLFRKWLAEGPPPDMITFGSWGRYDFNQLKQDCAYHGVAWPFHDDEHANLKNIVAEKMRWSPNGLGKALARMKMGFEGTHHRGIDDARNILRVVRRAFP